jgi:hypothetical protein
MKAFTPTNKTQKHILGFETCFYNYVFIKKDICD